MEWRPTLHRDVVAIEKASFWIPSTTVANFPFISFFDRDPPGWKNLVDSIFFFILVN